MSSSEILYPDPHTIPAPPSPSYQQPIPLVTLSELIPGKYVSTVARVVFVRTAERQDALGTKTIFSGILEDSTFKVPFVSHRISYPLIRNSIYKFHSSYVHEFPTDKSLLVVITEHTKIDPKNVEDYREYIWNPKVDLIKRPVKSVSLNGIITTVYSNSGLVKRCNKCKSIMYDTCAKKCSEQGWGWDLRVSSRLYDGSGSIKMVLTKDIASRVLNRNLGELILLASQNKPLAQSQQQQPFSVKIKIPESIEVIEAVTENASYYRSNGKLIVTDVRNLVFFPPELEQEEAYKFSEHVKRPLKTTDIEDRKIIKKLIEKALDISIKKVTGIRMMQGIYLLEEPISLYRCERAKLYLGFSLRVSLIKENQVIVEATPQAYVRESVLDYVKLRRERGATANAVVRNLLTYRNKVIVAPSGNYGCIVDVVTTKAGNQRVSETDSRNLVEFWKQVYGIDISPDEIPLLKVKMMNSENVFTYPPSMCFFGSESLLIYGNVQRFIENKKYSLKAKVEDAIRKAVQEDLQIGSAKLKVEESSSSTHSDVQSQLLQEIRQKLFGRNATARGSIMFVHDELWFFPNQIQLS